MMKQRKLALVFLILFLIGQLITLAPFSSHEVMRFYACLLMAGSLIPLCHRVLTSPYKLISCHSAVLFAPVWFLYLEAVFSNGDVWNLPPEPAIVALSYSALFLFLYNSTYAFSMPAGIVRVHDNRFLRGLSPSSLAIFALLFTAVILLVILAYNGFEISRAVESYSGGRSTGSGGLIKRSGLGGAEVFLQPLSLISPVVPTVAALSWVRFGERRLPPLYLRVFATLSAAFIIFLIFLGGSRGNLAEYLAGPLAIWLIFGRRLSLPSFILLSILSFLLLVGVWQFQVNTRSNLLDRLDSFSELTSFNPAETHRDNNLYLFTLNVIYMPDLYPFEGYSELGYLIVNPIPRFLWPEKPKGIQESDTSFSTVVGPYARGPILLGTASLSSTVVSDGYKMHHVFGIFVYALVFGCLSSAWDSLGQSRLSNSNLYFILNAAWAFWLLWGFRSGFAFVSGMYTVWGAYLFCVIISMVVSRRKASVRLGHSSSS